MATARNVGLLRLRATRDTLYKGAMFYAGDAVLVEAGEAERLCQWGAFELTDQARARLYGHNPWVRVTTR
jgi:hypothetical protein